MKKIIIAAALAVSMGGLQAQTSSVNIATTAVPFLRISPDARAAGMGDIGIATGPDDANSSFHNLAKLPFAAQRSAIAVNYTPWMHEVVDGVYLASVAGYHQLDEQQAVAFGLRYFNIGDYGITDYSGNKLGAAHPREFALDGGYTRKLSSALSLGLAFRYIHSDLASGTVDGTTYKAGNALATDVSLYYHGVSGFSGGVVLSNLGTKINYTNDATSKSSLPTNLGLGLGYTITFDDMDRLTIGAEANHLLAPGSGSEYQGAVGLEYEYDHLLSLRTGYHIGDKAKGDQSFLTAGVGLNYHGVRFDLSYLAGSGNGITRNPLSNTVRLGLSFGLGKTKK
jgi:hypothetical protein